MHFKKNRAILAAVLAAATASSALMSVSASAERTKKEAYGDETYAARFMSVYDDVVTNGEKNGYLSSNKSPSGGFGVPYHSVEELICEAPDYGHETTSEAMSYIVWVAAMHDNIVKDGVVDGASGSDLAKAWDTLEALIPEKSQQPGFWSAELSSQVCAEYPNDITKYPSEGNSSNTGKNPIHKEFTSAYSEGREYLLHWLADVDDWYGFGGSARGTKGNLTFINTFNRGDQESCFETIPHPSIETMKYGTSQQGMKFAFQASTVESWSYTNAPDAEDRAIQAVYAANRWGVSDSSVTSKAGMMGDFCRNDMFDKYYKAIGCQSMTAVSENYTGDPKSPGGQHFLMAWYTAWGGAADGMWAWQIGCSHSHQFYQNPLAAYGLLYDSGLSSAMKTTNAKKDYTTSLERQMELYLWLQSAEGPFAGGCTNCWDGNYSKYPSNVAQFYNMAYVEHPVYKDPGSNHWTGNQFWSTQRLAELYYVVKTEGDSSSVKPGGLSLEKALETLLDNWVEFFVTNTELTDDDFSVPSSLNWSGQPENWDRTYKKNSGLHCEIVGMGNTDLGCANSLANTLIHYAKAKGVDAEGEVKEGTKLEEKALYLAQRLMDYSWNQGRDDIGLSRPDSNKSLARMFEQVVYIPSGITATYPYGYEVKNGSTFYDLRPMYDDVEGFAELKAAYEKDKAAGVKMNEQPNTPDGTNCDDFTNVGEFQMTYHRFWHVGDVMMALGTMHELYPKVTPTGASQPDPPVTDGDWGNVDCSTGATVEERINVSDAVLLARVVANDKAVKVTDQGMINAHCNADEKVDDEDLTLLLKYLAKKVTYDKLGPQ